jgi:ABC-2 type transport system permease protein
MQSMFPVFFVFLFFSSMAMPRDLIEQEWFRTVATINPLSYLIEGIRSFYVSGIDGEALALAFGISLALIAVFLSLAAASLRTTLVRT